MNEGTKTIPTTKSTIAAVLWVTPFGRSSSRHSYRRSCSLVATVERIGRHRRDQRRLATRPSVNRFRWTRLL
ncbi:hypothetical protein RP20_CCG005527 [Aedes albopictus]|nr:hypothetical protein RP20_CCG005527 [Aedes albopictus]